MWSDYTRVSDMDEILKSLQNEGTHKIVDPFVMGRSRVCHAIHKIRTPVFILLFGIQNKLLLALKNIDFVTDRD